MDIETFDTETINGKAFLIASHVEWREVSSFDECMEFLLQSNVSISFAYNMDYDASAVLKFLPSRDIDKLYLHNILKVNGFRLTYLPSKVFRVEGSNIRSMEMFDLMQFYNMSLENASQKYLGEGKDDIPLEVKSDLGRYYHQIEWTERIRFYCLRDARLTYDLAKHFLGMLSTAGVDARKYYSTGYLAGRYLNRAKTGKIPEDASRFISPSYYGGRNECTMRGTIPRAYIYDIKSAYPSVIRNLHSLQNAKFKMGKKPDKKATYHFIRADVTMKPNRFIYPIPWKDKRNGFIYYPRLTGQTVTVTGPEWDVLQRHNLIDRVKNPEVLNVYCTSEKPFSFVDNLFSERQKSDAHSYIFKLILNSIYGKVYQKKRAVSLLNDREMYHVDYTGAYDLEFRSYWEYAKNHCPNAYRFYDKICSCRYCTGTWFAARRTRWQRKKNFDPVVVRNDAGDFQYFRTIEKEGRNFNVLYATLITSTIRSLIYDAAVTVGEDFIACFTDSIFSRSPIASSFIADTIGMFELKAIAYDLTMIGSGVYEYDCLTPEWKVKTYTRFRGFSRSGGIRDLLDTGESGIQDIELKSLQRITWGIVVQQTKTWHPNDFNRLVQRTRKLHINFDHKRIWDSDFTSGSDVLLREIHSKPREI